MKIKKAVIPAAGLGTRFLPATKAQPKEMLPIVDKPTIQYIVEEAVKSGIEDIVIVNGRNKGSIEDHFDRSVELELELERGQKTEELKMVKSISEMANIYFIRQKKPLGLGHAVLSAQRFIGNEPFAVLLGDDVVVSKTPALRQMMDIFNEYNNSVVGVQTVAHEVTYQYGIVDGKPVDDRVYKVRDLVEKPPVDEAPSDIAILGRYILTPDVFRYLENQERGAGGEIQLTDAIKRMAKDEAVYAYDFKGHRYDCGSKIGFLQASIEFGLRREELRNELEEYIRYLAADIDKAIDYD
ncbi:MAG TPA: UTP--glucose-1-phosphate uridylyltransferase [Lachnospiraceae bacterium]|nr:UTP--glucose-1-phosphate uridylyltransferase GalU [Lachnospiraceae bacterium]MBQ2452871.1 UTP--glucose-1-phosphate uridylyltransferase GalU [Lachnospiraceae bacterium]MBQ4242031.1 UTP--glucose-1-phosphate uridylyltransferase GalU [Lachnospiraceae bacterium]MBQ9566823.1 UTP--glucose-1-phosphate uridylyltransferase GalU [Lachnospiraceae bacterium]MCR4786209.1 UTP--glucose-1-phosphate uridylyltransferase GalU [Lachnospiraceae bacterium]